MYGESRLLEHTAAGARPVERPDLRRGRPCVRAERHRAWRQDVPHTARLGIRSSSESSAERGRAFDPEWSLRTKPEAIRRRTFRGARADEQGRGPAAARSKSGTVCGDGHGHPRGHESARTDHQGLSIMNHDFIREMSRRTFLGRGAAGLGMVALNSLLNPRLSIAGQAVQSPSKGIVNPLDIPAQAKRVIYLYQAGGPSHLETFDYKPKLAEMSGTAMPESLTRGQQIAQLQGQKLTCFGPTHGFQRFGESGQMVCELFPHIGGIVDETCIVRSMWTEQINHDPAHTFMNSGSILTGRPSVGSWVLYGLGAETENLPGFVVLVSQGNGGQMQPIVARQWSAGILPSKFQGVRFNSVGDPVLYITNPHGVSREMQQDSIQTINTLNALHD